MTKPRKGPWLPADYNHDIVVAMKALNEGKATAHQQKMALDWFVNIASATYDEPYYPDSDGGDRNTAFACGRAFVGRQVVKLVNYPAEAMEQLRKKEAANGRSRNTEQP